MITIKINEKEYQVPTKVQDLTLGQFFKLRQAKDILDEICALTGIDRETISNVKSYKDLQAAQAISTQISISMSKGFDNKKLPKEITFGGKTITVPKELKLEPVGAFVAVHDLLATQTNVFMQNGSQVDYTDQIPQTLAHYLYVPYTGELYSDEKAEGPEFMEKVNQIRFVDAVPMANFFFRKYPNL